MMNPTAAGVVHNLPMLLPIAVLGGEAAGGCALLALPEPTGLTKAGAALCFADVASRSALILTAGEKTGFRLFCEGPLGHSETESARAELFKDLGMLPMLFVTGLPEANVALDARGTVDWLANTLGTRSGASFEELVARLNRLSPVEAVPRPMYIVPPGGPTTTEGGLRRALQISGRNLQKVFTKHGGDFGLSGNWNPSKAADVSTAINLHINAPGVQAIKGVYRGQEVIHYLDPITGLNVVADMQGNFIGGWKLGAEQLQSVLSTGRLF
jgi:hypothetical protein